MHLNEHFMAFNLIYWTPMSGKYFFGHSLLEKCGKILLEKKKKKRNTPWAATAGLGPIG